MPPWLSPRYARTLGSIHAVLGENGAGKSTLIKSLTGAYHRDGGTIELDGREIDPRGPVESQALGIGTVYQEVNLLENMSVSDNLFLGWQPVKRGMLNHREMHRRTAEILKGYGLDIDPTQMLSSYSIAIQQVIAIARAVANAPLILLAQNRQENRDKVSLEEDRRRAEQTKADTEFLARELAALRLAVGEVATRDYLRRELEEVRELLETLQPAAPRPRKKDSPPRQPKKFGGSRNSGDDN